MGAWCSCCPCTDKEATGEERQEINDDEARLPCLGNAQPPPGIQPQPHHWETTLSMIQENAIIEGVGAGGDPALDGTLDMSLLEFETNLLMKQVAQL